MVSDVPAGDVKTANLFYSDTWCTDYIENLLDTVFYIGDPDMIMSCLTFRTVCQPALRFDTSLLDSFSWQALVS